MKSNLHEKKADDNVWPRFVISTQNSLITKDLFLHKGLTFLLDGLETVFPYNSCQQGNSVYLYVYIICCK